jgi:LysM repeat protein
MTVPREDASELPRIPVSVAASTPPVAPSRAPTATGNEFTGGSAGSTRNNRRPGWPVEPGLPVRPAIDELCPYLTAASGAWRSATPHRDHRCGGVDPPALLSTDKQRRLCLSVDHGACPIFWAARSSRAQMLAPGADQSVVAATDAARRPITRTAVVILEHPRISMPHARWPLDRALSQAALVVLMIAAFIAVAIARFSSPEPGTLPPSSTGSQATASPQASASATRRPTPLPSPSAAASGPPSSSAVPASSEPTFRTTYTVEAGDTLFGIANRFGTTVTAIRALNGITDSTLRIGQVLKIP